MCILCGFGSDVSAAGGGTSDAPAGRSFAATAVPAPSAATFAGAALEPAFAPSSIAPVIAGETNFRWNAFTSVGTPSFVTFNFMTAVPSYDSASSRPAFAAMTLDQQASVRQAMGAWASVSGLVFLEVSSTTAADIRFGAHNFSGTSNSDAAGYAYFPFVRSSESASEIGGDIWINQSLYGTAPYTGFSYHVLLHEIGHAIGLKHPFEGANANSALTTSSTVMAYTGGAQTTPQSLDVLAAQHLYGAVDAAHFWDGPNQTLTIYGTALAETLLGARVNDVVAAGAGNDLVHGLDGNDWLFGGDGSDVIRGDLGDDVLYGDLVGESGTDSLSGGGGNDILIGGDLFDMLDGGSGADWIFGSGGSDSAYCGDGNDVFYGDLFSGEVGNDIARGGAGNDILIGGVGDDTLYGGGDDLSLGSMQGTGNDWLFGSDGNDLLYGRDGNDVLYGDLFSGEFGNDILLGEEGNDILLGGVGADTLNGGEGLDQLYGQDGADRFVFATRSEARLDVIYDFDALGGDVLDLRGVYSVAPSFASFLATSIVQSGTNVFIDLDGAGTTFGLTLLNVSVGSLNASNVLLA